MVTPGTPDVESDVEADDAVAADVDPTEVSEATDTTKAADSTTHAEPGTRPAKRRRLVYVTLPGLWGALIASCLSFTPSLLPRSGIVEGIVWGISAAIGYGLGVLAAAIWREFADRETRSPRRRSWLVLAYVGGPLLVVFFALGQYWQSLLRELLDVTEYNVALVVASPLVAVLVFSFLVAIGRGIRGIYHWLAKLLTRWAGRRAAHATAWIAAAA